MAAGLVGSISDTYKPIKINLTENYKKTDCSLKQINAFAKSESKGSAVLSISEEAYKLLSAEELLVQSWQPEEGNHADNRAEQKLKESLEAQQDLMFKKQLEAAQEAGEAEADGIEEMGKIMIVFRRLSHGDNVPLYDERKLMEYDEKMYSVAKSMQSLAKQLEKNTVDYDSLWDDDDEDSFSRAVEDFGDSLEIPTMESSPEVAAESVDIE